MAGEAAPDLAAEVGLSSPGIQKRWAREYRRESPDALRPKPKGRPRAPDAPPAVEITELERLRLENERLLAEVAYVGTWRALSAQERR
ncbi:helix-turn-helix domain-containing protein [Arthrobacter sp. SO5]|uniref:helix-turn-helix domain-containing protein n=1 Tax=Arthrobacter sp. SO5 TaxID=1897055 RepID=UPI0035ABF632